MPSRLPSLLLSILFIPASSLCAATVHTWTPDKKTIDPALATRGNSAMEMLCKGSFDACDVGLEFGGSGERISELEVQFATLTGRAYEPTRTGQFVEVWLDGRWVAVESAVTVDYRGSRNSAPLEGAGVSRWTFQFAAVETPRIRLMLTEPRNVAAWDRGYAVRFIEARFSKTKGDRAGFRILGQEPEEGDWLEQGMNLATARAGATVSPGNPVEVRWFRPVLSSRAEFESAEELTVEWWDGVRWRGVEVVSQAPGMVQFLPISATAIRLRSATPARNLRVTLDSSAREYAHRVEQSRFDLLGERFRRMENPGLAAMRGMLLPLDFAQGAIGLPADEEETHVAWNGTFFMTEPGEPRPWNHDPSNRSRRRSERFDRWFAFAEGDNPQLVASDWGTTTNRYAGGWLPATVTVSRKGTFEFEQTLRVTAPTDAAYGTFAELKVTNRGRAVAKRKLHLAMGRRRNAMSGGRNGGPLAFWPEAPKWRWDPGARTVINEAGEVVAAAETAGTFVETGAEDFLTYELTLDPGQGRTLRFLIPSVTAPARKEKFAGAYDWNGSASRVKEFWGKTISEAMELELPEPELNDIYKNLLVQAWIITLDGEKAIKYGSYSYEMYFGVEEGWPAIALAQFGLRKPAEQILGAMLAPELMDKKNYHHQYRNGLEPFYAVTAYRLLHDRAWLEKIAPALEEAAEWTIKTIHANKDPKYGGILLRHVYGGDIHTPAYSLYSNATCWRGLKDTALAFQALGRVEQAKRYEREAAEYRARLNELADRLSVRKGNVTFLPMAFEIGGGGEMEAGSFGLPSAADYKDKEPPYEFLATTYPAAFTWGYLGNFWNLFAPMLLEVKLFDAGDARSRWIPDYMEQRGGISAGLARFTIGLDQIYGKGYYESLLEHGERSRFLTSLYGVLAHGMSRGWNSFPEVAGLFPLRFDNKALWKEATRTAWDWGFNGAEQTEGQPLSAGPGMALQLLRMALVRETAETDAQDVLRVFDGAPTAWFAPGKQVKVKRAPTFFGELTVESEGAPGLVRVRLQAGANFSARQIVLRIPHPGTGGLKMVTVNGEAWRDFSGDEIKLPGAGGRFAVSATY